jgi:hypothetical protein
MFLISLCLPFNYRSIRYNQQTLTALIQKCHAETDLDAGIIGNRRHPGYMNDLETGTTKQKE